MVSYIPSHVIGSVPCEGLCRGLMDMTWVFRFVGNDGTKVNRLRAEFSDKGLKSKCDACCEEYYRICEVLNYQITVIRCVNAHDDEGARVAKSQRDAAMKHYRLTLNPPTLNNKDLC